MSRRKGIYTQNRVWCSTPNCHNIGKFLVYGRDQYKILGDCVCRYHAKKILEAGDEYCKQIYIKECSTITHSDGTLHRLGYQAGRQDKKFFRTARSPNEVVYVR
jgi:hypothetical protein